MTKSKGSHEAGSLTRRGFLGRFTLGLAGLVGLGFSLRSLLAPTKAKELPQDGLPEDSIFQPRDDLRQRGRNSEKV